MQTLPREHRLRGRDRIGALFREGARGTSGCVTARALPNDLPHSRLAAVAGKKIGCAAERNRMRRRLRAAYRLSRESLPPGWDLALLARPGLLEATWRDLCRDLETAVNKAVRAAAAGLRPSGPRP